jgi:hypothetical protein
MVRMMISKSMRMIERGRDEKGLKIWTGKPEEKSRSEDLGTDGGILLK